MYSQQIRIRYSEISSTGELSLVGLVDLLQDIATFHSEDIGYGTLKIKSMDLGWFVTNYSIKIHRLPKLSDFVTLNTMPYSFKKIFGLRAYEMRDAEGNLLLTADSTWVLMDGKTLKPTQIPQEMESAYIPDDAPDVKYSNSRLKPLPNAEELDEFRVPATFIDTNGHMNNAYYVDVMSHYLPDDFSVDELIINYKKPALEKDLMKVLRAPIESGGYQIRLEIDGELSSIAEFR